MYSVEELQQLVEREVKQCSDELATFQPSGLYEPVIYSLAMGGKRLRPVLVLMGANMFLDEIEPVLPAAVGIEVFHNFTLLHDDIMDHAAMRRNQPTVHKKFSENAAILSGDAMAFQAVRFFLKSSSPNREEATGLFVQTAIEVCEGQQFDMDFETRLDVTEAEYLEMIRLKTAVLLACSLKVGAVLAGASPEKADFLYRFGIDLGLAFQLQDDLLDTFGDEKTFGKKIGGDILANKKTLLLINALEKAEGETREQLLTWMEKTEFDPEEKIRAVKQIYEDLGVRRMAEGKVELYFKQAMSTLNKLDVPEANKEPLIALANRMLTRKS